MSESLDLTAKFPVSAKKLYEAWMSSKEHTAFTGSEAEIDDKEGGEFKAWDGYIWGKNIKLKPNEKIVQSWRTSDFPEDAPDSETEIVFKDVDDGVELEIKHTKIPDGQAGMYQIGWDQFYFGPMASYFSKE